ncbi:hypothetical protein [Myxococcus landrumensis]|uniref:Integron gene cassette protein n=1 Tax=Myxococcus landrumensis TaxID=2813577 RepID=A0ABX7NDC0_9BACT|nr:hypothetical protein [Myxococcus landrumus]QSQ16653.1 hypothetical protein JY572_11655 [Myxococcus landrumus]
MTTRNEVMAQWAAVLSELRALFTRDPRTKPELRAWVEDSISLSRRISSSGEVCNKVEEVAWHYLADADIRVKCPEYAEVQRADFEGWLREEEARLAKD